MGKSGALFSFCFILLKTVILIFNEQKTDKRITRYFVSLKWENFPTHVWTSPKMAPRPYPKWMSTYAQET